jgi:hypothetical protein
MGQMSTESVCAGAVPRQHGLVDRNDTKEHRPKKHGIYVTEHKRWNTKEIFNNGYRMIRYGHQPKLIRFRSPMVNDFNQHLCGGWSMFDIPDKSKATFDQLVTGRKPLCDIVYWYEAQTLVMRSEFEKRGFPTYFDSRHLHGDRFVYRVTACHRGTLEKLFDLDALLLDYESSVSGVDFAGEMWAYRSWELQDFLVNWDTPAVPLWVTGLILGYPVENTISIYLGQVR